MTHPDVLRDLLRLEDRMSLERHWWRTEYDNLVDIRKRLKEHRSDIARLEALEPEVEVKMRKAKERLDSTISSWMLYRSDPKELAEARLKKDEPLASPSGQAEGSTVQRVAKSEGEDKE